MRELSRAVREVRVSGRNPTVNVEVGPFVSARWLVPRLSTFQASHPKVDVVLHHSTGGRLPGREIDLGLLWGDGSWKAQEVRLVFEVKLQPLCMPKALEHIRASGGIAGNHGLPFLHARDRLDWEQWFSQAGLNPELAQNGPVFDEPNVVFEAAVGGQGVAMGYFPFSTADIRRGRLAVADPVAASSLRNYYLVLNTVDVLRIPSVRQLHDWIISESEISR